MRVQHVMGYFVQCEMLHKTYWILQLGLVTMATNEEPSKNTPLNVVGKEASHDNESSTIAGLHSHGWDEDAPLRKVDGLSPILDGVDD